MCNTSHMSETRKRTCVRDMEMRAGREGAWERAILTRPLIKPCQEKEAADTAPALVDADGLLMTTQLTSDGM